MEGSGLEISALFKQSYTYARGRREKMASCEVGLLSTLGQTCECYTASAHGVPGTEPAWLVRCPLDLEIEMEGTAR